MQEEDILIRIHRYESGQLKAFVDVTFSCSLGEFTLCGLRIIQKEGQDPWIAFPTIPYEKDGTTRYKKMIEAPQSTHRRLALAIFNEFRK
jgi:DNA-binding cell septation regulator SpoVG